MRHAHTPLVTLISPPCHLHLFVRHLTPVPNSIRALRTHTHTQDQVFRCNMGWGWGRSTEDSGAILLSIFCCMRERNAGMNSSMSMTPDARILQHKDIAAQLWDSYAPSWLTSASLICDAMGQNVCTEMSVNHSTYHAKNHVGRKVESTARQQLQQSSHFTETFRQSCIRQH